MRSLVVATGLVIAGAVAAPAVAKADVVWLCKPGEEPNPCRESLETTVYEADGSSRVENPPLPEAPPIDCFYVYPTVSNQPTTNATKDRAPEVVAIARYQAARFSLQCRVFAPVYRQLTVASIFTGTTEQRSAGGQMAYGDVREAWREYLARDNSGRGVVLIGHSQGVRMLRQLIREEIDRNDTVRSRLVSALLLGGNVLVRKGRRDGGDFQKIPACADPRETGCAIAYSTFNEPPPDNSRFGRSPARDTSGAGFPAGPDYEVLCSNPASLAANTRTPLTTYFPSEPYPPGFIAAGIIGLFGGPPPSAPTPWLQPADRYRGRCETQAGANVLMIEGIGAARRLNPSPDETWGLHLADVNIALGELVGLVGSQAKSYLAGGGARPCLPRRGRIEPPRIGPLRLGRTRQQLLQRTGVTPVRRAPRSWRWCTEDLSGALSAVFSRGRARMLITLARGYRIGGVGVKRRLRVFLRRFPRARLVGDGVYRAGPNSALFFGVRPGGSRVRFVGVAARRVLDRPRLLDRYLDRAELPFGR